MAMQHHLSHTWPNALAVCNPLHDRIAETGIKTGANPIRVGTSKMACEPVSARVGRCEGPVARLCAGHGLAHHRAWRGPAAWLASERVSAAAASPIVT